MLRKSVIWALALFIAATVSYAQDGSKQNAEPPQSRGAIVPTDPNYVIGPQDMLNIDVWKESELTKSVPVRPDGKISLPLLNDVQAAGLTPLQLGANITAGLKKYITDPQVTVTVTAIESQRIYILGEVSRPGAFPLVPGMTAVEALSSAGGFTPFASVKKIYIIRKEEGKPVKYPLNYKEVIKGNAPQQNIVLKSGDTIVVP